VGTDSRTIFSKDGSSRLELSRLGRVKPVEVVARAPNKEGRMEDLWPGEVEELGILGILNSSRSLRGDSRCSQELLRDVE